MNLKEQLQAAEIEKQQAEKKIEEIKKAIEKGPKTGDVFLAYLGGSSIDLPRLTVKANLIDNTGTICQTIDYVDSRYTKIFNVFDLAQLMVESGARTNHIFTRKASAVFHQLDQERIIVDITSQIMDSKGLRQLAAVCLNWANNLKG